MRKRRSGDGDFIVGEFGRLGRIAVPPLFAGLDALQVVAFQIAFRAGAVAGEGDVDGVVVVSSGRRPDRR